MVDSQSNSNDNMVNLYNSRLKELNINQIINDAHSKLTQWREECHKTIDELYQRKLEEFDNYINEIKPDYEEKRTSVQRNISQLNDQQKTNEQNPDLIKQITNSIQNDLDNIEQSSIQINLRPLVIDENHIHIEKKFLFQNISSNASKFSYSDESSSAIASNDKFLLMHQNPYLSLIDRDSKIVKQNIWNHGWIRDMCWSSTLNCFVIITPDNIYFVTENLQSSALLNENIKQAWFSCTCSNKSLYLSTCEWGSSIYELNLSSSFDVVNHWKSPLTCQNHEGINDIKYNNGTLALMIRDPTEHKKRMELKSAESFDTLWSLPLSIGSNIRLFTCCSIKHDEWLVVDGTTSRIYHITKDGKFGLDACYHSVPYRANLFNSNLLVISAENELSLHKL
jgi:hypothetical protein